MDNWSWVSPKIPQRKDSVLRHILETRAEEIPHHEYVKFEDGSSWTYSDTLGIARQTAAALAALGVSQGDVVLTFLPNGPEFLEVWFGTNFLGAALAAPNTALRGALLQHLIVLSGAKVAIVHASYVDRMVDLDLGSIRCLLVVGDLATVDCPPNIEWLEWRATCDGAHPAQAPDVTVEPWQTQFILFTSGTTGPSKGVIVTYVQMHDMVMASFGGRLGEEDNYLLNMPLFHVSGTRSAMGMMMLGGKISLVSHFRTESFWDTVREHGTTACVLLGGAASFLEHQPKRLDDADNPMRLVAMIPLVKDPNAWADRFGVNVTTSYGMSEVSIPIISSVNPSNPKSCGRLRPGYEARIVDEYDIEVSEGMIGELILRADRPWTISPGYWCMPEATAEAWRNGWFHTGDYFSRNSAGDFFFVDRKKDCIRRRGENISSFDVEAELLSHPMVVEAAAIAVPSPHGEDDILAVLSLASDANLSPISLFDYLRPRMAHFMLPRYLRFVDSLPKTPSLRIKKDVLRDEGVTTDTWDREVAGIIVKREV